MHMFNVHTKQQFNEKNKGRQTLLSIVANKHDKPSQFKTW